MQPQIRMLAHEERLHTVVPAFDDIGGPLVSITRLYSPVTILLLIKCCHRL